MSALASMPVEMAEAAYDGGNQGRAELTPAQDRNARLAILASKAEHKPQAFAGAVSGAMSNWAGPSWYEAVSNIGHGIRHGQQDDVELGRLVRTAVVGNLVAEVDPSEVEEHLEGDQ